MAESGGFGNPTRTSAAGARAFPLSPCAALAWGEGDERSLLAALKHCNDVVQHAVDVFVDVRVAGA